MQDGENIRFLDRAKVKLDQVAQSKSFRNLLLVSFGVGFAALATSIASAALDDYQGRASAWERAYSSSLDGNRRMGKIDFDSPPLLPLIEPSIEPTPDVDLELAITTNDPASVIASAAKSVLREDGKRYRVTVTVESTPNESNERKL